MIKNIALFFIIIFSFIISYVFGEDTIYIDIGNDLVVTQGDIVELNAIITGNCGRINEATIYWLELNDKGDWSSKQTGSIENTFYSFQAQETKYVKGQIRCPNLDYTSQVIDEDIILITVLLQPVSSNVNNFSSKMSFDAQDLFIDDSVINNINLVLDIKENYPLYELSWNYLGGEGYIKYVIEYSIFSDFKKFETIETLSNSYSFIRYDLNYNSMNHYFRVKACFLDKCSNYSNVFSFYLLDLLEVIDYKIFLNDISYLDLLNNYILLIEKYSFKISFNINNIFP